MARLPRLTVPGYPHHVIQRGNNRQNIFRDDRDREQMLELWREHSARENVAVHAYVLMSNHIHFLATPQTQTGLSAMMQAAGRRYVQYFNHRHHRSGTLWEGRFRSSLIQSERYLLACMVYIDLNPVRAGMVNRPADYPWSSHGHCIGLRNDRLLTPHPLYWQLGNTPFAREAAYAELVTRGLAHRQQAELGTTAIKGWALGDDGFLAQVQKLTGRRTQPKPAGRPVSGRSG